VSVVEFMLSSFPLLFFEGWPVVESGVAAKLFFGRLMAATTAAPPRIILRRDKQLDPSSESGDLLDRASFVCIGMFIAISSVALGSEIESCKLLLGLSRGPHRPFLQTSLLSARMNWPYTIAPPTGSIARSANSFARW
jgi:hypothetical protein